MKTFSRAILFGVLAISTPQMSVGHSDQIFCKNDSDCESWECLYKYECRVYGTPFFDLNVDGEGICSDVAMFAGASTIQRIRTWGAISGHDGNVEEKAQAKAKIIDSVWLETDIRIRTKQCKMLLANISRLESLVKMLEDKKQSSLSVFSRFKGQIHNDDIKCRVTALEMALKNFDEIIVKERNKLQRSQKRYKRRYEILRELKIVEGRLFNNEREGTTSGEVDKVVGQNDGGDN
eukprot:GHVS01055365.1.p1 GENE.GHVS01055365.1~~GHVS01055365.1.p1  ORF type:complete len:235 (+),score=27.10 GHVS01055365.1:170-874(+)